MSRDRGRGLMMAGAVVSCLGIVVVEPFEIPR